jgi:O-antigen/teichoic acid export membrane protein
MRKKNIYKSAFIGLLEEVVAIICGFILPRMILTYFGSDYNGIVAAVTQFIGCIALLKSGIGMATKAALYEPLYNHDQKKIDGIMAATMRFLRKVAAIFVAGIVVFACVYPLAINKEFPWFFTFSLVLIISLGTFFQYYFGLGNQLLLEADQKYYIVSLVAITNTFFNTVISVICMKAGMSIHGVKLCSALVYCTTPVILYLYVNKTYHLNRKAQPDMESISKRWDAFGMQIANFVNNNTDIIVASLFLSLKEVSVYTIYYLAINGIKKVVSRISVGVEAALGNIIAENNKENLQNSFSLFEFVLNFLCTVAFSCLIILIVPFVNVYTKGVTDVNYTRYAFGIIACAAELFYCLRLAYTYLVQAKGAFAETKRYYYIEAVINIVISVALVNWIGLVGIVIGTLIAMVYRTIVFAVYVFKHILERNLMLFVDRMVITVVNIIFNYLVCSQLLYRMPHGNYLQLFLAALPVGIITLAITSIVNGLRYKKLFGKSVALVAGKLKKKGVGR